MRSSPKGWICLEWKEGRAAAQQRAFLLLYTLPLFSLLVLFLKQMKKFQKMSIGKLWETTRSIFRMSLPQHVLKEKGKKTDESWSKFSKWISYHFPSDGPPYFIWQICRAVISPCSQVLLFQVSHSLLDPAHISMILLFSYLVHMLKLYISAKFLEHLNKCLQLTIQHLIYHLFFVVVSCIVILLLCLTQLQMIQSCVR